MYFFKYTGGKLLDYFKISKEDTVIIDESDLRQATKDIFLKFGLSESNADLCTDVLLHADLRGIETHGVSNMLRTYVQMYQEGKSNPNPNLKIVRESFTTATVDGDGGLGLMTAAHSMDIAIEKAEKYGMGAVAIKNSGHLGAAGYFAMMALPHDMIGWCMTAGGKGMIPTFGAEPQLGTNPIAIAIPTNKKYPFVFDAAMTSIAGNKIGLLERMNKPILAGWVANPDGSPDMKGGSKAELKIGVTRNQLPLGSTRELGSHKGYGLALLMESLAGVLSGANLTWNVKAWISDNPSEPTHHGAGFLAFNIGVIHDINDFLDRVDGLIDEIHSAPKIKGVDRLYVPGEMEWERREVARGNGITLPSDVVLSLKQMTQKIGLETTIM